MDFASISGKPPPRPVPPPQRWVCQTPIAAAPVVHTSESPPFYVLRAAKTPVVPVWS